MAKNRNKKTAAILMANGFNYWHYNLIVKKLKMNNIRVIPVSPEAGKVKSDIYLENELNGIKNRKYYIKSLYFPVDVIPDMYDMLIIPGGPFHSYKLLNDQNVLDLLQRTSDKKITIATIAHSTRLLAELPERIKGKFVTSPAEFKQFFLNAGAIWIGGNIAEDNGIITCSHKDYIHTFITTVLTEFRKKKLISEMLDKFE